MQINPAVELKTRRCMSCHRWWAAENDFDNCGCPFCSQETIREHYAAEQKMERKLSALRGVITKLSRKGKKR